MNLLVLDTTRASSVLVALIKGVNYSRVSSNTEKHNETLLTNIENLLNTAKANISDIDVFGCVTGPGSFTGIRVGMSTTKALALAQNKKIISASVFDVVASSVENGLFVLNSTNTTLYYADIVKGQIKSTGVVEKQQLESMLNGKKLFMLDLEHIELPFSYNDIEIIKNYSYLVYSHFKAKLENKEFVKSSEFSPLYLQVSQAEISLDELKSKLTFKGNSNV